MLEQTFKLQGDNFCYLEVFSNDSGYINIYIRERGYDHEKNDGSAKYDHNNIYPVIQDVIIKIPESMLPGLIAILQKIKF